MQKKKTGKLFNFVVLLLAIIAKRKKKEKRICLNLGEDIGLLFQLADDFLDINRIKKKIGKPTKKDKKKGKSTLINLMGYKKAYNYANNLKNKYIEKIKKTWKKS